MSFTRSLGADATLKELVVCSPYTTETELMKDDEFIVLATSAVRWIHNCPNINRPYANIVYIQLWGVANDQEAVDIIRNIPDAQDASHRLVEHVCRESNEAVAVLVIRFQFLPGLIHNKGFTFGSSRNTRKPPGSV